MRWTELFFSFFFPQKEKVDSTIEKLSDSIGEISDELAELGTSDEKGDAPTTSQKLAALIAEIPFVKQKNRRRMKRIIHDAERLGIAFPRGSVGTVRLGSVGI